MENKAIAKQFIAAVNAYIEMHNEKIKRYGLTEYISKVDTLEDEGGEDLLLRFSALQFPDHTPHRHLYFFEVFKQNDEYIAFGGNDNYNDVYVVEKQTGKVLVFSEEEEFLYSCADSFAAFLEAFTILIELETHLGQKKTISHPQIILDSVVAAAGGEEYRAFFTFLFPIQLEKILN